MRVSLADKKELGNTGIFVSPLGYGASPLGKVFGEVTEKDGINAVLEAAKRGINFFDVSPYYGSTLAETVLGKALRQLPRDSFVLSTKCGRYGGNRFNFTAEHVTRSVEESMSRLGVEYLDMIQCHDIEFGDLDQIVSETIPALIKLKEAGKVRAIGITGYPLEIFPYVTAIAPPDSIDIVLSYCNYTLQNDRLSLLMPSMKKAGIGLINASPLCMGLLTDTGGPDWHPADRLTKELCREASSICEAAGESLADVALKFSHMVDRSAVATTLVGIDSVDTLNKNLEVLENDLETDVIDEVLKVLEPVHNRRWQSGSFGG